MRVFLEPIPTIFYFLQGADCICDATSCDDVFELCIVLDCGDANRLGDATKFFHTAEKTICIDHHVSNQELLRMHLLQVNLFMIRWIRIR